MLYQGANVAVAMLIGGHISWIAVNGGSVELRVICASLLLGTVAGVHDWALFVQRISAEDIYLIPYSGTLMFAASLFAVQRRYVHAIDAFERLSNTLAQHLAGGGDCGTWRSARPACKALSSWTRSWDPVRKC